MCGITGIFTKFDKALTHTESVKGAVAAMRHRGPDSQGFFSSPHALLGHARLSVIDTGNASSQPFYSADKRYVMVYNGEFFNYAEHRQTLQQQGISFYTQGDTEVLLQLYITQGAAFIEKVNGFFTLAIYDTVKQTLFVARDRYGIKPLFYYASADQFIFASELKALLQYPVEKKLDTASLLEYLQLNYIPAPHTMLQGIKKFPAAHYAVMQLGQSPDFTRYYAEPYPQPTSLATYTDAKTTFYNLLNDAVKQRLVADVPLGSFLSGGLDSSAITALAAMHKPGLNTFSIGYKNEPLFDESRYAEAVSKKLKTNHRTFMLNTADLYAELYSVLDAIDEPFGDSSAIPVHILARKTKEQVTVALSGDAGDELMGGYNKHRAEFRMRNAFLLSPLFVLASPLLRLLPQSRNSTMGNLNRQALKLAEGATLNYKNRYWRWASVAKEKEALQLLAMPTDTSYKSRKNEILGGLTADFNSVLYADVKLVLQNDMLVKTDTMSMANSLEVRSPLLDHRIIDFLFSLPASYKINGNSQKRILRDTVAHLLPPEVITRKKHGFEVPLLSWFQAGLRHDIESRWLNDAHLQKQKIFNVEAVKKLKSKLFSNNPGDAAARAWGLIVFQHWYKKYMAD